MPNISLAQLEKALNKLKSGFKEAPSDLERDGLIQRFEYTLEVSWRSSQKALEESGIKVDSPKAIIRELAKASWIASLNAAII